jgi:hypothetical protein
MRAPLPGEAPAGSVETSPVARLGRRGLSLPGLRRVPPLVQHVSVALLAGAIAAGLGGYAVKRQRPVFASAAAVLMDQPQLTATGDPGIFRKISGLRFKYASLVQTAKVSAPVAERLKLPEPLVVRSVQATVDPRDLLIRFIARARQPRVAQQLAQATAEQVIQLVSDDQEAAKIPPDQRMTVTVVDPARPAVRISPLRRTMITVAATAGALAFLAVLGGLQLLGRPRRP